MEGWETRGKRKSYYGPHNRTDRHTTRVPVASQPVARSKGGGHPKLTVASPRKSITPSPFHLNHFPTLPGFTNLLPTWFVKQRVQRCLDIAERARETSNRSFIHGLTLRKEILVGARSPRLPRLYKLPVRRGNLTCISATVRKGYESFYEYESAIPVHVSIDPWLFYPRGRHEVQPVLVDLLVCRLRWQDSR